MLNSSSVLWGIFFTARAYWNSSSKIGFPCTRFWGVSPARLILAILAPWSSKTLMVSREPLLAARWSGVWKGVNKYYYYYVFLFYPWRYLIFTWFRSSAKDIALGLPIEKGGGEADGILTYGGISISECISTPYVGLVGSKCTLSIN